MREGKISKDSETRRNATPQFRVVEHRPWRRPVIIGSSALLSVLCLLLGYALGENKVFAERTSSAQLSLELTKANEKIVNLETQLIDAELNAQVAKAASSQLREDMTGLHAGIERLQEEVTFYRSLMAPGESTQGLQIAELDILPVAGASYHFELLLTQKAIRRRYINGTVDLSVRGKDESGNEVVKSFTELTENSEYPLKFKFRFFQDLTGEFTLPADMEVQEVMVTAKQKGEEPLLAVFSWPEIQGNQRI